MIVPIDSKRNRNRPLFSQNSRTINGNRRNRCSHFYNFVPQSNLGCRRTARTGQLDDRQLTPHSSGNKVGFGCGRRLYDCITFTGLSAEFYRESTKDFLGDHKVIANGRGCDTDRCGIVDLIGKSSHDIGKYVVAVNRITKCLRIA